MKVYMYWEVIVDGSHSVCWEWKDLGSTDDAQIKEHRRSRVIFIMTTL